MYLFAWLVIIVAVGSLVVAATAGWWLNRNQHRYPLADSRRGFMPENMPRPAPQLYDQDDEGTIAQDDPTPPPPPERKPIVGLE